MRRQVSHYGIYHRDRGGLKFLFSLTKTKEMSGSNKLIIEIRMRCQIPLNCIIQYENNFEKLL